MIFCGKRSKNITSPSCSNFLLIVLTSRFSWIVSSAKDVFLFWTFLSGDKGAILSFISSTRLLFFSLVFSLLFMVFTILRNELILEFPRYVYSPQRNVWLYSKMCLCIQERIIVTSRFLFRFDVMRHKTRFLIHHVWYFPISIDLERIHELLSNCVPLHSNSPCTGMNTLFVSVTTGEKNAKSSQEKHSQLPSVSLRTTGTV